MELPELLLTTDEYPFFKRMFGSVALAAKIADLECSQGSFLSASRLSRDGRKNSRSEVPKFRFYRD